jgi:rubredoxin
MEKNTWKCPKCGYTFEADAGVAPPETCPGCKDKCEFVNVSCYIPECGMKGQDPRLG